MGGMQGKCLQDRQEAFYERPDLRLEEMRGGAAMTERRPLRRWLDGGSYNGSMASIEWQLIG